MVIKEAEINVVQAAERRILECFNKHKNVCLSFSGGKDSICLSDMVVKTMQKYGIAFSRLMVIFFDEEAIYPDCEQITIEWRQKFLALGAKFYWFCLPIKHFNCCNKLANDETFICWEPGKESVWVRQKPKFAISNHAQFKHGMSYQEFCRKVWNKIPTMVGIRMAESVQRRSVIASMKSANKFVYPLYDWKDNDVWLYIKTRGLNIPVTYLYLYKVGVPLNKLRISQFFSIDTIKTLPKVLEFYPDLYERIIRREPNADLVMLYWDTEMFRSSKQDNAFGKAHDERERLRTAMLEASKNPQDYPGYDVAKRLYAKLLPAHSDKTVKRIYEILIAGDPKKRTYRAVSLDMMRDLADRDRKDNPKLY